VTSPSFVFANLTALRSELSQALDLRLRTDHDLPLELFEAMTAIDAGERSAAGIALRTGTSESDAVVTIDRLSARELCLLEAESPPARVRGLTLAGGYLFTHASAAYEEELNLVLGGPLSHEPAAALADILHLLICVDRRSIHLENPRSVDARSGRR
jgi:hypothetical protein